MKTSVRAAARDALRAEKRAQTALLGGTEGKTVDSFVNFAQKMGIGADNALTSSRYGFNPVTRNRIQLEWVHRGSWLGGVAIDIVADDMTRAGADFTCEMDPQDQQKIDKALTRMGAWDKLGDAIRWGRLYGGAIAVMLVDGQDLRQPLRPETVGPEQFKGLLVLDRWMLEPVLDDLVTEYGPDLGLPKYYRVGPNAPALRGAVIHHTRVALRHVGIELPYQQALTENLWGLSVIERLWDRMTMFDMATTGAGQLINKAFLRTMSIKDLRAVVAAGNKPMEGLLKYMDTVRRYQNLEGITLIDAEDELAVQEHGAFSGLADAVQMFAQQVSGALQIPLTRLLGQSPKGLGNEGESDVRTYFDNINQQQNRLMHRGTTTIYELTARSEGVEIPDDFGIDFASLWQLDAVQKATVAKDNAEAVGGAYDRGLITQQGAMKELRQSSKATGVFTNITAAEIDAAETELAPPGAEEAMGLEHEADQADKDRGHEAEQADLDRQHAAEQAELDRKHQAAQTEGSQEHEADQADMSRRHELEKSEMDQRHGAKQADKDRQHKTQIADKTLKAKKQEKKNARPNGKAGAVGGSPRKRVRL